MSWPETAEALDAFRALCHAPLPVTLDVHLEGLRIAQRFGYHIYDSLILAAALQAECRTVYSEDMQHGQQINGLTIVNPFVNP